MAIDPNIVTTLPNDKLGSDCLQDLSSPFNEIICEPIEDRHTYETDLVCYEGDENKNLLKFKELTNYQMLSAKLLCSGNISCNLQVIDNKQLLLVTHPSSYFDIQKSAKNGIDKITESMARSRVPMVYLMSPDDKFINLYTINPNPNYFVQSFGGEHNVAFNGQEVTMIGGFFDLCFSKTLHDLLQNRTSIEDLTIKMPIDAIYLYDASQEETKTLRDALKISRAPHEYFIKQMNLDKYNNFNIKVIYAGKELNLPSRDIAAPKLTIELQ